MPDQINTVDSDNPQFQAEARLLEKQFKRGLISKSTARKSMIKLLERYSVKHADLQQAEAHIVKAEFAKEAALN